MRIYSSLLIPAVIAVLAWLGACHAVADSLPTHPGPCFVGAGALAVVDLDTGQWDTTTHKTLLSYKSRKFLDGSFLLGYLDSDLSCSFLLVDASGRVTYRRDGYAAYVFGDGVVLAVRMSEALENTPEDWGVIIVDPRRPRAAMRFAHTIPLTPISFEIGADRPGVEEPVPPPLLMTFAQRAGGRDFFYPWAKELKFTAVERDGGVAWTSKVVTGKLLADLDLLYASLEGYVLHGLYDRTSGEYIVLGRESGELLCQIPSTILPIPRQHYPYINFADLLPVTVGEGRMRFPAYDSQGMVRKAVELDVKQGRIKLVEDEAWLSLADDAWLQRQQLPAPLATWERELDNGETLALTTEAILLRRGDTKIWSHELVPDLGTGLELEAFGEELILLVERPAIGTSLGAQGIPHLLNRETGGKVEIPVGPDAQYFVPLEFGGRRLLLTPSGVVFE